MTAPAAPTWNVGDRVSTDIDGIFYGGKIVKIKNRAAIVAFDDGDEFAVDLTKLVREDAAPAVHDSGDGDDDDPPEISRDSDGDIRFDPPKKGSRGAHHYPVIWDSQGLAFNVWAAPDADDLVLSETLEQLGKKLEKAENQAVHFYGHWRKTNFARMTEAGKVLADAPVPGWSIDLYARIEYGGAGKPEEYLVDSLRYEQGPAQGDPRSNMHILNSDICCAIRRWFFFDVRGARETVAALRKRADRPMLKVPSLAWLDNFIMKCQEVRSTALRAGGQRSITIDSGIEDAPVVMLHMDFTSLAVATDGKGVSTKTGGMQESIIRSGGRKGTEKGAKPTAFVVDPKNLADLKKRVAELNVKAKAGDNAAKAEARKIRAAMRKLGARGGARGGES